MPGEAATAVLDPGDAAIATLRVYCGRESVVAALVFNQEHVQKDVGRLV